MALAAWQCFRGLPLLAGLNTACAAVQPAGRPPCAAPAPAASSAAVFLAEALHVQHQHQQPLLLQYFLQKPCMCSTSTSSLFCCSISCRSPACAAPAASSSTYAAVPYHADGLPIQVMLSVPWSMSCSMNCAVSTTPSNLQIRTHLMSPHPHAGAKLHTCQRGAHVPSCTYARLTHMPRCAVMYLLLPKLLSCRLAQDHPFGLC